jgi:TetR/AcrR family transcriptional regulator, regulator of mycofactocin system
MPPAARGRPVATSQAAIEEAAFRLFSEHGFEGTTLDDIARAVGVGRRTLFRYFPSKNDIPWGEFDQTLVAFRATLEAMPADLPVHEAVHQGVLAFNRFPPAVAPSHRERMRLILTTPELQAHSVHQYAAWRAVISDYVAARLDLDPTDLLPQAVGQVSLALAVTAYEAWLADSSTELETLVDAAMTGLREFLA